MADQTVLLASGVGVRVRVTGREDGPALVLLHGLGESASTWDPVVDAFSEWFKVVALNLRGHGGSSWPGDYSFELL